MKGLFVPTLIMAAMAVVLLVVGMLRGKGEHLSGLQNGLHTALTTIPLILFAFIIAGMIQVLLPNEFMARWLGAKAGMRGILLGTLAGAFAPGGPFIAMPVAAAFMKAGAGIGTTVAFLTSWSLYAVHRIPVEMGIMGWRFAVIRFTSTLLFPPVAGLIAQTVFRRFAG